MKSLLGYRLFAIGSIGSLTLRFVLNILVARAVGAHVFGVYLALLVVPLIAVRVLDLSVPQALTYFVRRDETLLGKAMLVVITHSLVALIPSVAVALAQSWLPASDPEIGRMAAGLAAPIAAIMVSTMLSASLATVAVAAERFVSFAIINMLSPLLMIAGLLAAPASTWSVTSLIWLMLATEAAAAVAAIVLMAIQARGQGFEHALPWRDIYRFGLRAHIGVALKVVGARIDRVILLALIPPSNLAHYSVAASIRDILMQPANMYGVVISNRLIRLADKSAEMLGFLKRQIAAAAGLLTVAILLAMPLSAPLFERLYGADFAQAAPIFRILAPSALFLFLAGIGWSVMYAFARPGLVSWSIALSMIPATALLAGLAVLAGATGAAWGATIGQAVGALVAAGFAWRLLSTHINAQRSTP